MTRQVLVLVLTVAAVAARGSGDRVDDSSLVVHEWGTFTSVVDERGFPVEWRPFDRPDDLPDFVYSARVDGRGVGPGASDRSLKPALRALVRLETPVVYFYGSAEREVSASVSFPGGRLTEWYPSARSTPSRLDWEHVHVWPSGTPALPDEGGGSRYYAARATDAAALTVEGSDGPQNEKFLFYRGVGRIAPPVLVALRGGDVVVSDYASAQVSEVVLFENRGGAVRYLRRDKKGRQVSLRRDAGGGTMESLRQDLAALLVAHGLHPKEAAAMVETWGDSWFEEGLRVFYVVPTRVTEAALPLTIDPAPSRTVRVLVARTEILSPERLASLAEAVRRLPAGEVADGTARALSLAHLGRFAEPGLRRLLGTDDARVPRDRIRRLLGD